MYKIWLFRGYAQGDFFRIDCYIGIMKCVCYNSFVRGKMLKYIVIVFFFGLYGRMQWGFLI